MADIKYAVTGLIIISTLCYIASIGDERKPITRGNAIAQLIVNALLIWWILTFN